MPLINGIVVRLRFLISILICTYGYLRVSSASLETDILYFTFKIFSYYVLVLHLADDGFAFVLKDYELINEIVFLVLLVSQRKLLACLPVEYSVPVPGEKPKCNARLRLV